jgi:restriction endonuclease Mrr
MIEDMRLAGLCEGTQQTYQYAIALLAKYYQRSPELLTEEQVAAYLRDMLERRQVARGTFQTARFAMQFLFGNTLQRNWALLKKRYARPSANACRRCLPPTPCAVFYA